jgi:hypothetical protein
MGRGTGTRGTIVTTPKRSGTRRNRRRAGAELHEQHARLASIGLIPKDGIDAACAMCGQTLGNEASPAREAVVRSLERAERRVELAQRDRPLIAQARESILERRREQMQVASTQRESRVQVRASDPETSKTSPWTFLDEGSSS